MDSWEQLSIKEKRLSAQLDDDIKLVILPEKFKLIEPPAIPEALQHNLAIFSEHEEHLEADIAAQLEAIEDQQETAAPRIPEFLWDKFIDISSDISEALLVEFLLASADSLEQVNNEYMKQDELQQELRNASTQTKKWISFISAIWAHKKMLLCSPVI
ncbi:Oidioi.mRNA.OKI2018_I69.XSR.g14923.t1.cds [Oikopleura dioica]|uniref:Oidioi.mRNA.OKI2018_I69.XSR.g14923.t1.cds n=1 Tax=Oikopleura dioica TaxID=34765 RepID=A0ABN7SB71_OIKDI|nr:Oidioi.mRNA.OKI2018_I69.XSR.g14923.t1.cds [Oikopleura dioica]